MGANQPSYPNPRTPLLATIGACQRTETAKLADNEFGVKRACGLDAFQDINHVARRNAKRIQPGDDL